MRAERNHTVANTMKLREQRANIWEQMKALINLAEGEDRNFTGEEKSSYDKMESDLDSLGDRIERAEHAEKIDAALAKTPRRPSALFTPAKSAHCGLARARSLSHHTRDFSSQWRVCAVPDGAGPKSASGARRSQR